MAKTKDLLAVKDGEEVLAKLVKRDDGYHVIDQDGTEGPVCNKRTADGYIILTKNAANRKCVNEKNAEEVFANGAEFIPLTYKETRIIGSVSKKIPNEKLVEDYATPEEKEEYYAIINDALARMEADKAKPLTEKEKLEAQIAKGKAKLAELLAKLEGAETDAE